MVVGPFISGLLLAWWGPAEVFAVFAAVALVSAALVSRLGISAVGAESRAPMNAAGVVRESLGGFRFLFGSRHAGLLVLVLSGGIVVVGALDVLFVAVASRCWTRARDGPAS